MTGYFSFIFIIRASSSKSPSRLWIYLFSNLSMTSGISSKDTSKIAPVSVTITSSRRIDEKKFTLDRYHSSHSGIVSLLIFRSITPETDQLSWWGEVEMKAILLMIQVDFYPPPSSFPVAKRINTFCPVLQKAYLFPFISSPPAPPRRISLPGIIHALVPRLFVQTDHQQEVSFRHFM